MDSRWWRHGGEAVDQLQLGKELRAAAARAGFASGVEQVLGIALLQTDPEEFSRAVEIACNFIDCRQ